MLTFSRELQLEKALSWIVLRDVRLERVSWGCSGAPVRVPSLGNSSLLSLRDGKG